IEWRDGYGFYFYNGVRVSEKIITTPELLTKEDWVDESNTEVRRVIQERIGSNFVKMIGGKRIHTGKKAKLYEVNISPDPEEIAKYIGVKDSSTNREYYLRVPPTMTNADEAWVWTLNLSVDDIPSITQET